MGLRKPDAAAYAHVVDALGSPAERCVFVDDRAGNCDAAREAGKREIIRRYFRYACDEALGLAEPVPDGPSTRAFLETARDDLVKAISEINRTARKRFAETFEEVRRNYIAVFQTLFKGGKADLQLVRNLAVENGPHNVRVNAISPGLIRTDFARALWENPDILKRATAADPLRRIGRRYRGSACRLSFFHIGR